MVGLSLFQHTRKYVNVKGYVSKAVRLWTSFGPSVPLVRPGAPQTVRINALRDPHDLLDARSRCHGRQPLVLTIHSVKKVGHDAHQGPWKARPRPFPVGHCRDARRIEAAPDDAKSLGGHAGWDREPLQRAGCRWGTVGGGSTRPEGRLTGGCRMTSHPAGRVCHVGQTCRKIKPLSRNTSTKRVLSFPT